MSSGCASVFSAAGPVNKKTRTARGRQDCVERIGWCRDEARLTRLTVNYIPLADSVTEVLEYLEGFGENVIDVIG